jgi:hypothetical protein
MKKTGTVNMEKRNLRNKNLKIKAILGTVIILLVVVAKSEIGLASILSKDQEVIILKTNTDEKADLAQMTIISQIDQQNIPMKRHYSCSVMG